MSITEKALTVRSRDDLVAFIEALREDLVRDPDEWENDTIERYLAAMASWTHDMEGYFRNQDENVPSQPSWGLVAAILAAAKYYE